MSSSSTTWKVGTPSPSESSGSCHAAISAHTPSRGEQGRPGHTDDDLAVVFYPDGCAPLPDQERSVKHILDRLAKRVWVDHQSKEIDALSVGISGSHPRRDLGFVSFCRPLKGVLSRTWTTCVGTSSLTVDRSATTVVGWISGGRLLLRCLGATFRFSCCTARGPYLS